MDKKLYTMIVYSENIAGLLNQITAVFTRRQINIESLNVSASSIKGVHKYTITAWTDEETIKKIVRQIEKKIDGLQAHYFTDEEIFAYEMSTPVFEREPKVSELIRRYNARVVEVNPTYSALEKDGTTEDITAFYDELQKLGCVLQFVRSGRVALTKSCVERVNEFLADREARYLKSKQTE